MLDADFRKAKITGVTEVPDADALGEGPFHAGPRVVPCLEFSRPVVLMACLERVVLVLGANRDVPGTGGRTGAVGTPWTGQAVLGGEADVDDVVAILADLVGEGSPLLLPLW